MSAIATIRTQSPETISNEIGFANLTEQVQRKLNKRPFQFTLMLVGECGSAQSTLIENLFHQSIKRDSHPSSSRSMRIESSTMNIEELGVRIRLRIVRTRGFANCLDDRIAQETLLNYIEKQFERYFQDEYGFQRQTIVDRRVHCLLYLISSLSRGLKPLDIQCIKALQNKVNVIPIIVKADALTNEERIHLKRTILEQIGQHRLPIYRIPDGDPDEGPCLQQINENLKRAFPFAIITSKTPPIRVYPWGQLDIYDGRYSDLMKLRTLLITHMYDLQDLTHEFHYEQYRLKQLRTKCPR